MGISEISLKPKQSGSGGLWGKIAGGLLGLAAGIAAPFTGGASVAAAAPTVGAVLGSAGAGLAAGTGIGGAVGSAVDPAKVTGGKGVSSLQNYMKTDNDSMMAALDNAMKRTKENAQMDGPTKTSLLDHFGRARTSLMG